MPNQYIQPPFDPTALAEISGAQLYQYLTGAQPFTDTGFAVVTTDTGVTPDVPDANANTELQRFVWIRRTATSVSAYVWNPVATSDPVYLKWLSLNIAGIGTGSITGDMIADNTIPADKIISLDYSQLTGVPTGFAPSGAAGGDLTGTYPNPTIAAGAVTTSKIDIDAVTTDNILDGNVTNAKLDPNAVGLAIKRTNAGATAVEDAVVKITELANPTGAEAGKTVQVKADGTGFEYAAAGGTVTQQVFDNDFAYQSISTVIPFDDTIPAIGEGTEILSVAITPKSATSKLVIELSVPIEIDTGGATCILAVFNGATPAIAAFCQSDAGGSGAAIVPAGGVAYVTSGVTTALTISVRIGITAGNVLINGFSGARKLGGVLQATLRVTEVI